MCPVAPCLKRSLTVKRFFRRHTHTDTHTHRLSSQLHLPSEAHVQVTIESQQKQRSGHSFALLLAKSKWFSREATCKLHHTTRSTTCTHRRQTQKLLKCSRERKDKTMCFHTPTCKQEPSLSTQDSDRIWQSEIPVITFFIIFFIASCRRLSHEVSNIRESNVN